MNQTSFKRESWILPTEVGYGTNLFTQQILTPILEMTSSQESVVLRNGAVYSSPEGVEYSAVPGGTDWPQTYSYVFNNLLEYISELFGFTTDWSNLGGTLMD